MNEKIRLAAKDINEIFGFNVLPLIFKRPAMKSWDEWQKRKQMPSDLNSFYWGEKVTGIGVISGIDSLRVIDLDGVNDPEIMGKILEYCGLPQDYEWLVISGSGKGYHIWVRIETEEGSLTTEEEFDKKSVWKYEAKDKDKFDHLELRWKNCQTAIPPSLHESGRQYSFVNGTPLNEPATILSETVLKMIKEICEVNDVFKKSKGKKKRHGTEKSKEKECQIVKPEDYVNENELEEIADLLGQKLPKHSYEEWLRIGFALASLGEKGRKYFLKLSCENKNYEDTEETVNIKFDELLRDYDGRITLGSLYTIAEKYGYVRPLPRFWNESGNKLEIVETMFLEFLKKSGFGKMRVGKDVVYVRNENNIIKEVTSNMIKDYVVEYINGLPFQVTKNFNRLHLFGVLLKQRYKFFNDQFLEFLSNVEVEFKRDTENEAFFYFKNCFVRVTDKNVTTLSYSDLDKAIWENQIIARDFEKVNYETDFFDFLMNICKGNKQRYDALVSAIGYLLHTYKDVSKAKAIILLDEKLSEAAFGRSGKGLVSKSISKLRNVVSIDGRNFRFDKSFAFQSVNLDTDIICFDDAAKKFSFDRLFSVITEGITVEKKNRDEFFIPFESAPKILITTNYSIDGTDDSTMDREFVVEFSDFYNKKHRPIDDFDKRFFDDWDKEEWLAFDNFMIRCAQFYLHHGLCEYEFVNLEAKKLIDSTSPEFAEFTEEIELNREYNKRELFERFKSDNKDYENMKQNTFTRWVKSWASLKGYEIEERKSSGERFVTIKN